ncbi:MAG: hypothetical protein KC503_16400 [Myxococcales bacterium]|nr:hypothetical protein [Myxococcales bacterium]
MRRLAAAIVVLCCTPSSALADDVVEISLGAGIHKLSSTQDLGDYAQLANVRSGIVGTTLAAFDLRAQYCIGQRLCLGPLLGAHVGRIGERAALLLSYRAEAAFDLLTGRVRPFVAVSGGAITLFTPGSVVGRDTDPVVGWSAGLKVRLWGRTLARLDFTHSMSDAQQNGSVAHTFTITLGLSLGFVAVRRAPDVVLPPLDSDGDGVLDRDDRCPNALEDPDGYQDDDGCPDPDNDGDGVPDDKDLCRETPGVPPDGCPKKPPR